MTTTRTLAGTWFDDSGLIADLAPRSLTIEIIDGKAYDPELAALGGEITIEDGTLRCWAGSCFMPDAGELARVGLV